MEDQTKYVEKIAKMSSGQITTEAIRVNRMRSLDKWWMLKALSAELTNRMRSRPL